MIEKAILKHLKLAIPTRFFVVNQQHAISLEIRFFVFNHELTAVQTKIHLEIILKLKIHMKI